MTDYLLLAFSVCITLTFCIIRNSISKKHIKNGADLQLFNAISSAASAVLLIVFALVTGAAAPSLYTVVLGVVFGVFTAVQSLTHMQALKIGPLSYTTLIVTAAMLIPAFSGPLLFDESVTWVKYVGAALMAVSILLSVINTKGNDKKATFKWLVLTVVSMLFSGFIGILQKVHQSSDFKSELLGFLVIAFCVSELYSVCLTLYYSKAKGEYPTLRMDLKSVVLPSAVTVGVFVALANQINLYLSGVMDAMIFFPVVNGAGLILSIAASAFLLKEKLTPVRWCGIAVGTLAIFVLCLF